MVTPRHHCSINLERDTVSIPTGNSYNVAQTIWNTGGPFVVVAGDLRSIDAASLERFGRIVRVDPTDVVRDPLLAGFGREMPLLIDE